jgi:hypothetical protein
MSIAWELPVGPSVDRVIAPLPEDRAGRNLPASRKRVLTQAKDELRRLFDRD